MEHINACQYAQPLPQRSHTQNHYKPNPEKSLKNICSLAENAKFNFVSFIDVYICSFKV